MIELIFSLHDIIRFSLISIEMINYTIRYYLSQEVVDYSDCHCNRDLEMLWYLRYDLACYAAVAGRGAVIHSKSASSSLSDLTERASESLLCLSLLALPQGLCQLRE